MMRMSMSIMTMRIECAEPSFPRRRESMPSMRIRSMDSRFRGNDVLLSRE
jgi:hypothetical protein